MSNLPNVKLPDNPPSLDILNMASASKEEEEETSEAREMETGEDKGTRKDEVLEETEEEIPPL